MKNNKTKEEHIANWESSGLSKTEYCRDNEIHYSTFQSWIRKISPKKGEWKPISIQQDIEEPIVFCGKSQRLILLYMYRETRSTDFLKKYLKGYTGIIKTDGYTSYDAHFRGNENILHAGCMAHARREFEKFWKANKNPIAGNILNQIRELYKIEDEIRTQGLFHKELFSEIVRIR